jgi:hypothetical protein
MKNGILHPFVFVDDMLFTNVGLRSGSKHFYTILSAGIGGDVFFNRTEDRHFIFRAGFGYEYSINKFFIDIDLSAGSIYNLDEISENWTTYEDDNFHTQICQLRLTAGYKIFEHLGIFGGISYDYLYKGNKSPPDPKDFSGVIIGEAFGHHIHKLGFFGGIQF